MEENKNETNSNELETPVYIKEESIPGRVKTDHSKAYILPSIRTRYLSVLIDTVVIFLLVMGVSAVFMNFLDGAENVRGILIVLIILLYEPLLVTFGTTLGQLIMNIRARSYNNPEKKLSFPLVLVRFIVKVFLGWVSFLTVTFNINRRAIHDFVSGSIMVTNKL